MLYRVGYAYCLVDKGLSLHYNLVKVVYLCNLILQAMTPEKTQTEAKEKINLPEQGLYVNVTGWETKNLRGETSILKPDENKKLTYTGNGDMLLFVDADGDFWYGRNSHANVGELEKLGYKSSGQYKEVDTDVYPADPKNQELIEAVKDEDHGAIIDLLKKEFKRTEGGQYYLPGLEPETSTSPGLEPATMTARKKYLDYLKEALGYQDDKLLTETGDVASLEELLKSGDRKRYYANDLNEQEGKSRSPVELNFYAYVNRDRIIGLQAPDAERERDMVEFIEEEGNAAEMLAKILRRGEGLEKYDLRNLKSILNQLDFAPSDDIVGDRLPAALRYLSASKSVVRALQEAIVMPGSTILRDNFELACVMVDKLGQHPDQFPEVTQSLIASTIETSLDLSKDDKSVMILQAALNHIQRSIEEPVASLEEDKFERVMDAFKEVAIVRVKHSQIFNRAPFMFWISIATARSEMAGTVDINSINCVMSLFKKAREINKKVSHNRTEKEQIILSTALDVLDEVGSDADPNTWVGRQYTALKY
jgi:hypothetical protein